jgi:hypothetical protein
MSTAWQGKILAGTGSALFIASTAAYFAKACEPLTPIVAMGIAGLFLTLVGLIYTRKADEWRSSREAKSFGRAWNRPSADELRGQKENAKHRKCAVCGRRVLVGQMYRMPEEHPKRGLMTCVGCFHCEMGRAPNPFPPLSEKPGV